MFFCNFIKYIESVLKKDLCSKKCLFLFILFRLFNSIFVITSFFPDEYAQSIEIAHYMVFNYGHLPWEWEPCISLRSILYPLLYAILFYILKITKLDYPIAIVYAPKLFQGICAAFGDYGLLKLIRFWYLKLYNKSKKRDNENLVFTILICHFFCWFYFYCICRTSSPSFECILNIWGIYFLSKNYLPLKESIDLIYISDNDLKKGAPIIMNENSNEEKLKKKSVISDLKKRKDTEFENSSNYENNSYITFYENNSTKKTHEKGKNENIIKNERENIYNKNAQHSYDSKELIKIKHNHIRNLLLSLFISSICVVFRPNAAVFWLCIYFFYLVKVYNNENILTYKEVFIIGILYVIVFLFISIVIDSYYYGQITITFFNFFLYNFFSNDNSIFGEHPFHFYFSCVIPSVYLTLVPFTYYGFILFYNQIIKEKEKKLYILSRIDYVTYMSTLIEVLFLSFSKHKEHKLIIGYIPFFTILTGMSLYNLKLILEDSKQTKKKKNFSLLLNVSFFLHLIFIFFFSRIHNSSPEKVATYFRNLKADNDNNISIFITDCYDIPLYSHIHRKFKIGFLDCSPMRKDGKFIDNWRKIIYDDKFGKTFYDIFDVNKNTSNSIVPYILPEKSFYWFGHHIFNSRERFRFHFNKINFSCLDYRFYTPLNGDLPLYIVVNSFHLLHLTKFLKEYNYHHETKPFFRYFAINEDKKLTVVHHYIFKKY